MSPGRLLLSSLLLLSACGSSAQVAPGPSPTAGQTELSVDAVRGAVFEVVIPKYEPDGITYSEPLPLHLLPKHVRDDKYFSIGTAFTMDGKTFVSAAHVFAVDQATQYGARRLRDADGKIYEIDQFVGYSDNRDVVVFTLRGAPTVAKPLVRGATPGVGTTVYTVGNAQGEGLSVRGGNVSSFTPEPKDGAWKFIRYSAPASPGNSGGPLLDVDGRVVGIVVRKNDSENLNYAVPVEELDRLSAKRADFGGRWEEFESGSSLVNDYWYEADLPAGYDALAAQGQQGLHDALVSQRQAFDKKFRDQIFPTAPELREYLREQGKSFVPAEVVRDARGEWSTAEANGGSYLVSEDQKLYVGQSGGYRYAVLERPNDVPLATFVAQPERVIEAMLKMLEVERTVAGVDVRVTSLGAPDRREAWTDALGRPWTTVTWMLWADMTTSLHCTPYPRGLACLTVDEDTNELSTLNMYARINALRWVLSYDGRVKDWVEYLALDRSLRPAFLDGAVKRTGDKLEVSLGAYRFALSDAALTDDSLIYTSVEYASLAPASLRVSGVSFSMSKDGLGFRVDRVAQPLAERSRKWWEDVTAGKAPYDGKIIRKDESLEVVLVEKTAPTTLLPETGIETRLMTQCWANDPKLVTDKALEKACGTFRKGVTVSGD